MDLKEQLHERVARCVTRHARADIKLSSGKLSDFYFDGRRVSLDARGLHFLAALLWQQLAGRVDAVGGLTLGADPITGGVLAAAAAQGADLKGFICRKAAKEHGMGRIVEGPELSKGDRVALLDDVATTGSSFIQALEALEQQYGKGFVNVVGCYCIVDRQEGAKEALAQRGLVLYPIFTKSDFPAL